MTKSKSRIGRWVFTSDFHLNKLARFFPNHLELQRQEMRKPFVHALENGIDTVWIGGDLSEDPVLDQPALDAFQKVLIEFDSRLHIHIILGNHDFAHVEAHALQPVSLLCQEGKLKTVRVYEKPQHVVIDGVNFNMLPYPYTAKDRPYRKPAINVAHLEWDGAMRDNGKSRIKGGYSDKSKGKDFWLMGHLHTPQYLERDRVLYIGTQFQTNFGENADKSFCHVRARYVSKKLEVKFKRVPQRQAFMLVNLEINSHADFDKLNPSPDWLYKLWINKEVRVPKDLLAKFPNVVSWVGGVDVDDKPSTVEVKVEEFKMRPALKSLLAKYGLDKAQVKRGFELLKQIGETV